MTDYTQFDDELRKSIENAYIESGNMLGWRFLSSPPSVLRSAKIAFIGLNPGGKVAPIDHAEFAMKSGSAYQEESWGGCEIGKSPLQRQVLNLFDLLGQKPEHVLAGNLVPFRSPDWQSLKNKRSSMVFGKQLWEKTLARARPSIIVGMGGETNKVLMELLNVTSVTRIPVNWGKVTAFRAEFDGGYMVGLPHLSRFGIMTRPQSADPIRHLFPSRN